MVNDPKIIISLIGLLTVLLVALIFGRIHRSKGEGGAIKLLGDRVIAGLLAVPLISVIIKLMFPAAHLMILITAPLPVFIYTAFLVHEDVKGKTNKIRDFTGGLFLSVIAAYVIIIITILLFRKCT